MAIIANPNSYATTTEQLRYVGKFYTYDGPGVGQDFIPIERPVRLSGGKFWAQGASAGDHVSLSIVDQESQEVVRFCDKLPVCPVTTLADLSPPTAALILPGLSICVKYSNTGTSPVSVGIWISWFEV